MGDGSRCVADVDGDGYPATPLSACSSMNQSAVLPVYCSVDSCPTIYNIPQSDVGPCMATSQDGSIRKSGDVVVVVVFFYHSPSVSE